MRRSNHLSHHSKKLARLAFSIAVASSILWANEASAQLRTGRQTQRDFYPAPSETDTSLQSEDRRLSEDSDSSAKAAPAKRLVKATGNRTGSAVAATSSHSTQAQRGTASKASFVEVLNEEPLEPVRRSQARKEVPTGSSTPSTKQPLRVIPNSNVRIASDPNPGRVVSQPKIGSGKAVIDSSVQTASCPNCHPGHSHQHAVAQSHGSAETIVSEDAIPGPNIHDAGSSDVIELGEGEWIGKESYPNLLGCDQCGSAFGMCDCGSVPSLNIQIAFPHLNQLSRISARVEAATFWQSNQNIPPLVRTAAVGTAGSRDLFGGTNAMDETVQGWRGELGWTFGQNRCNMIQFRFFDPSSQSLVFDSNVANPTSIVRPYLDPTTNTQQSISVLEPGISTGSSLSQANSNVYGGDLLLKRVVRRSYLGHTELLAGYQTAQLSDEISVATRTASIPSLNILEVRDYFSTSNQFNGGVLGISRTGYARSWSFSGLFKLGLGNLERNVTISGFQSITVPGTSPSTSDQGLLARSTNNGVYNSNTFIISPEVNVTLGYRLTKNLDATVGYTYLGLPKVVRAADQIDPQMASNLSNPLTGAARPSFTLKEDDFSLHSLSYGLQYRY
jgi:hypothetical protein